MRVISFAVSLFLSLSLFASLKAAPYSYREELKSMAKKHFRPVASYSAARGYLMQNVHLQQDKNGYYVKDVYCEQHYRKNVGPDSMPNHNELNVEHTWPQSRFNHKHPKHIQKSDLHHLYPTDSKTNGKRANHYFGEIHSGSYPRKGCECSRIGTYQGHTAFEPPDEHKGNVARALFYFSLMYDIDIPVHEEILLRQWHYLDPVDQSERERNSKISKIQGNKNPFIEHPDYIELISDF